MVGWLRAEFDASVCVPVDHVWYEERQDYIRYTNVVADQLGDEFQRIKDMPELVGLEAPVTLFNCNSVVCAVARAASSIPGIVSVAANDPGAFGEFLRVELCGFRRRHDGTSLKRLIASEKRHVDRKIYDDDLSFHFNSLASKHHSLPLIESDLGNDAFRGTSVLVAPGPDGVDHVVPNSNMVLPSPMARLCIHSFHRREIIMTN